MTSLQYELRQLIYHLKMDYGAPLNIYRTTESDVDAITGLRTLTRIVKNLRKAIVLPATLARKYKHYLGQLGTNRNFDYGHLYDINSRIIILDQIEIKDFEPRIDDAALFEKRRYQFKIVERIEYDLGYLITMTETIGAVKQEIFQLKADNGLQYQHGVINGP